MNMSTVEIPERVQPPCPRTSCTGRLRAVPDTYHREPVHSWADVALHCDTCFLESSACWTVGEPSDLWIQPTIRQVLSRGTQRRPVRDIPAGTWVWDDCNDEPAVCHGWSQRSGCYVLEWRSGGDWCAWDRDSSGRPQTFELLDVEEIDWRQVNG